MYYQLEELFFLRPNRIVAGNKVSAPILDPNILRAIKIPKYIIGTKSENTSTENPADTEMKLTKMAFPLISMVSFKASLMSLDFLNR